MCSVRHLRTDIVFKNKTTVTAADPAIQECCVIAAHDDRRGETVKALVVLRSGQKGLVNELNIIEWARGQMAAYKSPRIVEFVETLPKSGTGKIQWRELQEKENNHKLGI
jgi:fatty-acyl-CoA synthase